MRIHSTSVAVVEILDFFIPLCEDKSTIVDLRDMALDWKQWKNAHAIFDRIRVKTLAAEKESDKLMSYQYLFEEICAKTLYNLSNPQDPFDSDSSFWVFPIALQFASVKGVQNPENISSLLKEYI